MKKISIAFMISALAQCAQAQTDSIKINLLDEVVVTATKSPKKLSETGKVLTVITQQQLQQAGSHSLAEILNQQAGIVIPGSTASAGTNQTIYMRGASAGNTLILIDGVPVYDASGISSEFDIGYININQVERIEILKGAQSTLYGSDAVSGVINIIMKKAAYKPLSSFADVSAGSYGTFNSAAGVNGTLNKFQYSAGSSYIHSSGFSSAYDSTNTGDFDKDAYSQSAFNASAAYRFNAQLNVRVYAQFNQYKAGIDAGAFTDDDDYKIKNKNSMAGVTGTLSSNKNRVVFNYQYSLVNRSFIDDSSDVGGFSTYQNGSYKSFSHFIEVYNNLTISTHGEILAGADFRHYSTKQSYLSLSPFGTFQTALGDSAKVEQGSLYASFFIKNISGFNAEIGGRLNNHSIYGWNGTYSLNPSYHFNKQWKIFINVASAYHVPSLYQLYGEFGNKGLQPERSQTYETGIEYVINKVQARVVCFKRNIQNVISFYTDLQTYASFYVNADKQKDNGIEAELSVLPVKEISITANYAYTDGEITTASTLTGKDTSFFNLYRRPRNVFNLGASWQVCKTFMMSSHLRAASYYYEAVYGLPPKKVNGYFTIDLYAEYKPAKYLAIFADARNITNKQYFELPGYNTRRFNIMAGLRFNF